MLQSLLDTSSNSVIQVRCTFNSVIQVRCTWDENNPDRYSVLNKKYKSADLEDLDMKNYLASDSEDEKSEADEAVPESPKKKTKPQKTGMQYSEILFSYCTCTFFHFSSW